MQVVKISPTYSNIDFPLPWSIDQKIELFRDRVQGWQLDVAAKMYETKMEHRGFAQLSILMSYFEMIGKYVDGYDKVGDARRCFKIGFQRIYPRASKRAQDMADEVRERIRNGIYHVGLPRGKVHIYDGVERAIEFNDTTKWLTISPDKLLGEIQSDFNQYIADLKNPNNDDLRDNFEKRFDFDNPP